MLKKAPKAIILEMVTKFKRVPVAMIRQFLREENPSTVKSAMMELVSSHAVTVECRRDNKRVPEYLCSIDSAKHDLSQLSGIINAAWAMTQWSPDDILAYDVIPFPGGVSTMMSSQSYTLFFASDTASDGQALPTTYNLFDFILLRGSDAKQIATAYRRILQAQTGGYEVEPFEHHIAVLHGDKSEFTCFGNGFADLTRYGFTDVVFYDLPTLKAEGNIKSLGSPDFVRYPIFQRL